MCNRDSELSPELVANETIWSILRVYFFTHILACFQRFHMRYQEQLKVFPNNKYLPDFNLTTQLMPCNCKLHLSSKKTISTCCAIQILGTKVKSKIPAPGWKVTHPTGSFGESFVMIIVIVIGHCIENCQNLCHASNIPRLLSNYKNVAEIVYFTPTLLP